MLRFYEPKYIVLLIISLVMLGYLLREFTKYRNTILMLFKEELLYRVTRNYSLSGVFKSILLIGGALIFISLSIMGPQFGRKTIDVKKRGIDLIIALDVSRSMLAQDILPNRLERAKLELGNLISMLKGDRIGVILFAAQAFMQVPLTTDYDAARLFLKGVGVGSVPVQGTNFKSALSLANEMFESQKDSSGARAILILSDGEDHEGDYEEIVELLRSSGIRIYAIGLGSLTGEPIPEESGGTKSYKKDKRGEVVITRLNEGILKKIALSTGGIYVQGGNAELGIPIIMEELRDLKKGEISTKEVYDYVDRYWLLSLLSTILLGCAFFVIPLLSVRKGLNVLSVIFIMFTLFGFSPFLKENSETREGNNLYNEGKFKDAVKMYDEAIKKLNREPLLHYNKAAALIKEKRYNEAYEELRRSLNGADDKLRSKIHYNMGNLFLEQQKYEEAIDSYIKSIQFNPEALEPKHNLEMVLLMQQEQKQKENGKEHEDKKEENKKDEDKKDQSQEGKDKDREQPQKNKEEKIDVARAEQLLDSLKEKETDQPFSKFLIKDFNSQNVEKDW